MRPYNLDDDITIHQIDTGLTAVRKNYQGKGIATIMKIKGIQALQRIKNINEEFYIDTANADTNDQMLHINTKLGFREIYDLSSYEGLVKDLDV